MVKTQVVSRNRPSRLTRPVGIEFYLVDIFSLTDVTETIAINDFIVLRWIDPAVGARSRSQRFNRIRPSGLSSLPQA